MAIWYPSTTIGTKRWSLDSSRMSRSGTSVSPTLNSIGETEFDSNKRVSRTTAKMHATDAGAATLGAGKDPIVRGRVHRELNRRRNPHIRIVFVDVEISARSTLISRIEGHTSTASDWTTCARGCTLPRFRLSSAPLNSISPGTASDEAPAVSASVMVGRPSFCCDPALIRGRSTLGLARPVIIDRALVRNALSGWVINKQKFGGSSGTQVREVIPPGRLGDDEASQVAFIFIFNRSLT